MEDKIYIEKARDPQKILKHMPSQVKQLNENNFPFPISIEIQPTAICNLRCKWCSYWQRNGFNTNPKNFLPFEAIENISEFIKKNKIQGVYLAGGGEPCAYPYIKETAKSLHAAGASLSLISNGTLIMNTLKDVANLFSYFQISLISPDEENYFESTGSKFGLRKMKDVPVKIKEKWGKEAPTIGGMFVITQWNYKHIFDVIEFCKTNLFDYCSFRIAIDFEDRGVGLPEEIVDEIKTDLQRNKNIDEGYTNLKNVLSNANIKTYKPTKCININYGLYAIVDPKGSISLCVPDVGKKDFIIGSLLTQSFEEIWNSPTHKKIIDDLNKRYCSLNCHFACRSHKYNDIYSSLRSQNGFMNYKEFEFTDNVQHLEFV